ncbi:MAG: Fic family protein [Campylobacterales bacterium]|nr:Fic family protein [Campylobacterales bacterium]
MVSTTLQSLYNSIDKQKEKLDTFRPLSHEQSQNLKRIYSIDMTYHSNALEGNTLSYSETKLILEEGITIGGKSLNEHLEVINHKEALNFVEELIALPTSSLKEQEILTIHYLILKSIHPKEAGRYRTQNVGVKKSNGEIYHFCEPLKIQEKMEEFIEWLQKSHELHPIQRATLAHYHFVTIHPFIDGNGRTARILMNLILMQNGYVPAIIEFSDRSQYIQSIEKAQNENTIEDFSLFIAQQVSKNINFYIQTLQGNIHYL